MIGASQSQSSWWMTIRRLARLLLAAHGLDVVAEAGSVADALSTARQVRPAAALADVELPDGDGFALGWPRGGGLRCLEVRSQG
jgi:ActR/RegA family two-component response regulator